MTRVSKASLTLRLPDWTRRHDPVYWLTFVLLTVLACVPLWIGSYLPFTDLPQHLATIDVIHRASDPDVAARYTVSLGSTQYLLYYLTCDMLAYAVGVENASRLVLTLYAALLPMSLFYAAVRLRRQTAPVLLAFPLIFNGCLFFGFINYLIAFPFLFFAIGLAGRRDDDGSERPAASLHLEPKQEVVLGVLALLSYFSHLQVFLVHVGAMGLFALSRSRSVRDVLWRLRHLVPALALFGVWLFALDGLSADAARVGSNRHEALHGALWEPAGDTFAAAHTRLLSVFPDEMDERITTALFLVLGLVVALRGLGSQATQWRDLAPEALTLFVVAFYLLMPIRYDWIWPLNARFLPLAALLALLWGTATLPRWGERSLTALCGLIAAAAMLFQSVSFDQVDTEARDFDEVLEALRPGSRVRSIIFDRDSAQIEMPVYLHLVQYHAVRNGGLVVPSFAEAPQSPIRFRPPSEGGPPPTPLFADTRPSEFRFDKDARYFDYFVVRGEPADFASNVGFDSSVAFLMRSGTWTVYEHRRAD